MLTLAVAIWWVYPDVSQTVARQGSPFYLEMEVMPEKSSWTQVYWRTTGRFREGFSAKKRLRATGRWERIALPIKGYPIEELRFDPVMTNGFFLVRDVRLRTLEGRTIAVFEATDLLPRQQIAAIEERSDGVIAILIEEVANDPFLSFALEYPLHATLGTGGIIFRVVGYILLGSLGGLLLIATLILFDPRRASTWAGILLTLWLIGLLTHVAYSLRLIVIPLPEAVGQILFLGIFAYPVVALCRLLAKKITRPRNPDSQPEALTPDPGQSVRRVFLLVGLGFGGLFSFLTPLYQSPDELIWFYRIYDISEGQVFPRLVEIENEDGEIEQKAGAFLPVPSIERHWIASDGGALPFQTDRHTTWETVRQSWHIPFDPEDRSFRSLADTLHSLPPYLAQATGVSLGRALGLPLTGQFYAGRLTNLLAIIGLGYLVLRLTPCLHWTFAVVLLNPLALFLTASHSHDPLVTVIVFLILAYLLRLREQDRLISPGQTGILLGLFLFLAISKFNYVVLLPLTLLLPWKKFPTPRVYLTHQLSVWGLTALVTLILLYIVQQLPSGDWGRPDIDRNDRLREVLADPLGNLGKILHTTRIYGPEYLRQLGGVLGWLDTDVGAPTRWAWATLLVMALGSDSGYTWKTRWQLWERAGCLALFFLAVLSILGIFLLTYTEDSYLLIEGVQGRYFLALIPILILILNWSQNWSAATRRWWQFTLTGLLLLVLLGTSHALYVRYWVPVW